MVLWLRSLVLALSIVFLSSAVPGESFVPLDLSWEESPALRCEPLELDLSATAADRSGEGPITNTPRWRLGRLWIPLVDRPQRRDLPGAVLADRRKRYGQRHHRSAFSGRNSGTIGVALLGTFTSTSPTPSPRNALANLLAWKCEQRGITCS